MPSTVSSLFETVSIQLTGMVRWSESIKCTNHGIYIVSLSPNPDENSNLQQTAPIHREKVREWLFRVPTLKLNNELSPSPDDVVIHLSKHWLPDESIIYIGQTSGKTRNLRTRVNEFYRHQLGNRSPHAGGHWIKTLSVLNKTFVYYAELSNPKDTEHNLIKAFSSSVSPKSKHQLEDAEHPFPFANIILPPVNKKHGITNSKRN